MKKITLLTITAIFLFCSAAASGSLLAMGGKHDSDANNNVEKQRTQDTWSKDEWGDAEYPEDTYDTNTDKKKDMRGKESPWSKDEWGDAEYPEE